MYIATNETIKKLKLESICINNVFFFSNLNKEVATDSRLSPAIAFK